MPSADVTYTPVDRITVTTAGVYEINYSTTVSVAVGTTLTLVVRQNGDAIPSATILRVLSVGVSSLFSGSVILTLAAGDEIDMALSALLALGVILGSGVNATLTIKKLD